MQCFDYALKYIYRYPKTEKELKIQLYTKWYNTKDIDRAIDELKKKNYVNDEMFAESYIRSEVVNKGKPAIRIIQKLQQKFPNVIAEIRGVGLMLGIKLQEKYIAADMVNSLKDAVQSLWFTNCIIGWKLRSISYPSE